MNDLFGGSMRLHHRRRQGMAFSICEERCIVLLLRVPFVSPSCQNLRCVPSTCRPMLRHMYLDKIIPWVIPCLLLRLPRARRGRCFWATRSSSRSLWTSPLARGSHDRILLYRRYMCDAVHMPNIDVGRLQRVRIFDQSNRKLPADRDARIGNLKDRYPTKTMRCGHPVCLRRLRTRGVTCCRRDP